jgi:hypothetical protein
MPINIKRLLMMRLVKNNSFKIYIKNGFCGCKPLDLQPIIKKFV